MAQNVSLEARKIITIIENKLNVNKIKVSQLAPYIKATTSGKDNSMESFLQFLTRLRYTFGGDFGPGMMIAATWVLSILLWATFILSGQFIVGERTVPERYIEFLSNESLSFISSAANSYLPVAIMSLLYWQISRASQSHVKTGEHKQKKGNSFNSEAGNHISIPCDDKYETNQRVERSQNGGTGGVGEEQPSAPVHPERNGITEAPAGNKGNPTAHHLNVTMSKQQPKKRAPPSRERKVTRMITVILVAYVVTWTPFQVMKVIGTFWWTCVPSSMWIFSYWSLYMNSTVNPACYALCNVSFKKTFRLLLLCQHKDIRLGK